MQKHLHYCFYRPFWCVLCCTHSHNHDVRCVQLITHVDGCRVLARLCWHQSINTSSHHDQRPLFHEVTPKTAFLGPAPKQKGVIQQQLFQETAKSPLYLSQKFKFQSGYRALTWKQPHHEESPPACTDHDGGVWYQSTTHRLLLIIYICWSS